jgi:archaellum component FlaD/FlaE
LVSWKTKKQTVVARSSAEAKLRALACVATEMTWLRWLLADFGISLATPMIVHYDSTDAISIAQDPAKHQLTKHIGIDCFYVRSAVQDHVVSLQYVPSELQLADLLTKAHTRAQHSFLLSKLSVVDPS